VKKMVTVTTIAQRILDENNYTVADISIVKLEYLIDNAVDYINLLSGRSIAHVSGNNLTADYDEIMVVKILSALMIRAYKDRGPSVSGGPLNVAAVISDPQYRLFTKIVNQGINRLRGRSFVRT